MIKKVQPGRLQGFFAGIDPATQNDYFGICIHALFQKPRNLQFERAEIFKWTPYLVDMFRLRKRDPMDMTDILIRIFNKYPPTFCTIDSTREEFLANALVRKYGDTRIIPMKFANVGQMNTKFKLKQIGYAYIEAGYDWPDEAALEKLNMPRFSKLVRILRKEMLLEMVEYTETQRVTFKHPIGKHNDLVHAWEMSLNSVMTLQQKMLGFEKRSGSGPAYESVMSDNYRRQGGRRITRGDKFEEDAIFKRDVYDIEWNTPP